VLALDPDVVCLQEISRRGRPRWEEALAGAGLHVVATDVPAGRRLGVLTATRQEQRRLPDVPGLPWPERVLRTEASGVQVVNVHSPISQAPGLVKVVTHEVLAAALRDAPPPVVLCGDLNTPRREHEDGTVTTFGRDARHVAAEEALVRGLGWTDAFRALHGYAERSPSWTWPHGGGWRLDHVLVHGMRPLACRYVHEWRTSGLSDHSGLVAELDVD